MNKCRKSRKSDLSRSNPVLAKWKNKWLVKLRVHSFQKLLSLESYSLIYKFQKSFDMMLLTLAPCFARPSSSRIVTMQSNQAHDYHEEGFHPHAPYRYWEMIDDVNIILIFWKFNTLKAIENIFPTTHWTLCGITIGSWLATASFDPPVS